MSPIHLRAEPGEVAPLVLIPGDPGRARMIAEKYLEGARLYNDNRGLLGFTGSYRGRRVSVQTTGMGTPSAAIVVEELIRLGARKLVRVGTAGALAPGVRPGELVIASSAIPYDGTTRQYLGGRPHAPAASYGLLSALVRAAGELGSGFRVGTILTEDAFYATTPEDAREWARYGALAVEMESAVVFLLAAMRGVEAASILAVSNNVGDPELAPAEVLGTAVERAIEIALNALVEGGEDEPGA